ncbi:MAG TPA: NAD-dependent epimerase/dehydratase family protein [Candidatus Nitrosotenuis sp.]|nr:NAD-dependent epimerase/dehydratase family protein [Candidatus Nitrosotenuis sp.]
MSSMQQTTHFVQTTPYNILVTGATGFIGTHLISSLIKRGYSVKALSRNTREDSKNLKFVKADLFNEDELKAALVGIDVAYYLVHSMEGDKNHWKEFAARERIQAQNFLRAATISGVKRIIYLGGLVNESLHLSPHMKSRKEVGDILASGGIPVTQLRASLIIGAGGGSYAMLRYLVERLRIMVCPRWVKSLAQPIAVDDVVEYLVGCMEKPETAGRTFDIGGPERLTYEGLMRLYSAYLNKNLFVIQIPFLTTKLSSYWVDLITPVKASLARPLIDSLVHDTIVKDDSIRKIIPIPLKSVSEAIHIATKEIKQNPPPEEDIENRTSFVLNQKLLLISLLAMTVIGTTYYWLDDRPDVYRIEWLAASGIWFTALISSIIFVNNKTKLGYLIAGIVSWITLIFWLFDNYYVLFHDSVIATQPNIEMTIRNFIGVMFASLAIAASHNVFHKIQLRQLRGRQM